MERKIFISLLFISIIALSSALVAEHFFGLKPCILCIYQRIPYVFVIIFTILFLLFKKLGKWMLILCFLCFVSNATIATYHSGVERNFFQGPSVCSEPHISKAISIEELRAEIYGNNVVSCQIVAFRFMGLSLSELNAILCAVFSLISFIRIKRIYYAKTPPIWRS